jgi:hypothetical protein
MAKSNRIIDMQQEQIITSFLKKYLFAQLFPSAEFVEDTERQIKGIDVVLHENGCHENLDIKAQASSRYISQPVPTFVQELLFTNKAKQETVGWFLKELETDTYVYVWLHAANTNTSGLLETPEDVIEAEVMFVDKIPLIAYLESKGYTADILTQRARHLRKIGLYRQDSVLPEKNDSEMWLSYSADLAEKPVNLVIKKCVLKRFSTHHLRVTKTDIVHIPNDTV